MSSITAIKSSLSQSQLNLNILNIIISPPKIPNYIKTIHYLISIQNNNTILFPKSAYPFHAKNINISTKQLAAALNTLTKKNIIKFHKSINKKKIPPAYSINPIFNITLNNPFKLYPSI